MPAPTFRELPNAEGVWHLFEQEEYDRSVLFVKTLTGHLSDRAGIGWQEHEEGCDKPRWHGPHPVPSFGAGEGEGETVEVRIAVAVGVTGDWGAYGSHESDDHSAACEANSGYLPGAARVSYVTARVPKPSAPAVVPGSVSPAEGE